MSRAPFLATLALCLVLVPAARADDDPAGPSEAAWGPRLHVLYGEEGAMRVDPEAGRVESVRFPDPVRLARLDRVVGLAVVPTRGYLLAVGVEGTWACHLGATGWDTTFTKGLLAIQVRRELDEPTAHFNAAQGVDRENRILARDSSGRWWIGREEPNQLSFFLPKRAEHLQTPTLPEPPAPAADVGPTPISTAVIGPRRVRLFQAPAEPLEHWIVSDPTPGLTPAVGERVETGHFRVPHGAQPLVVVSVWPEGKDRTAFDALLMTRTTSSAHERPTPRLFHYTSDSGRTWTTFEATGWKRHAVLVVERPESVLEELSRPAR